MQNPNQIKLSLVDDHPIIQLAFQMIIKKSKTHPIVLEHEYLNATETLEDLPNLKSDVFLIDMCLPDMMGYELAKKILQMYPEMKIGIYSSMLDRVHILEALKNGVLGYLPKSASFKEVIDFILTIHRGEKYIRGQVADIIFGNEQNIDSPTINKITKREREILYLILDGFKNTEIAEKLSVAIRTVEFHKQNIYLKLDVKNSIDLYKAALKLNLIKLNNSFS